MALPFAQYIDRHNELAREAYAEAERLMATDKVAAKDLKRLGNRYRNAANYLLTLETPRFTEQARGLFSGFDGSQFEWTNVILSNASLEFEHCDFRGVVFADCDLRSVRFTRCDLDGARFVRTNVAGMKLIECQVDGAWFGDEEGFDNAKFGSPSDNAFCWNGGFIGSECRGVIHSGCTGQAIGLDWLADTGRANYGSSADYRASRND